MRFVYKGNVHEIYEISTDCLAIVTSDRISVHGQLLPVEIRNKGVILNSISLFWFQMTEDIICNHLIENKIENMPAFFQNEYYRGRTILVNKLKILPFEFIVRGYMFGRIWRSYVNGESFLGNKLGNHYDLGQKLDRPIITPTKKIDGANDKDVDIEYVKKCIGISLTEQIIDICYKLYERCSRYALKKGLIIADTKFEFGLNQHNQLVLADEIFTPDSSRFWDASDYKVGSMPKSYDKQILRNWLDNHKKNGQLQYDSIPQGIIKKTEKRYSKCMKILLNT